MCTGNHTTTNKDPQRAPRHQADGDERGRADEGAESLERHGLGISISAGGERAPVEGLDFGQALARLRAGGMVSRGGWNGRGQYVQLQAPGLMSKMSRPYLFIHTVRGDLVPWVASQTDLLATDWCVVREETALVFGEGRGTIAAQESL